MGTIRHLSMNGTHNSEGRRIEALPGDIVKIKLVDALNVPEEAWNVCGGACTPLNRNSEINEFRFWLELRRMFWQHNDIHVKLRNGRKTDVEELPRIEAYMGLFELVYEMLETGLIKWRVLWQPDLETSKIGHL